jgi:hypothetical protein
VNPRKSEDRQGGAEAAKHQCAQDAEVNVRSAGEGFLFHKKGCSGCEAQLRDSDSKLFFSRDLRAIRGANLFSVIASKLFIDSYENVTPPIWSFSGAVFVGQKNHESEGDKFCCCCVGSAK